MHNKIMFKVGPEMGGSGKNTPGYGSPVDLNLTYDRTKQG